jgi:hypothetical protein
VIYRIESFGARVPRLSLKLYKLSGTGPQFNRIQNAPSFCGGPERTKPLRFVLRKFAQSEFASTNLHKIVENPMGTATVTRGGSPTLRVDGPCLTGTLAGLSMPPGALEKIKADALDLLSRVVAAYAAEIADGEVGALGSGLAGPTVPPKPCTGLLYGRIQSGKTVAMIALVAAAIDNGFRAIVVLTSDNLKLVSQTTQRFAALDGPIAVDALTKGWESDHRHIGKKLGQAGVVFVCSKNKTRLDNLLAFLEQIGAPNYPALVLDDEADQATLDTNLAKNSRSRASGAEGLDPCHRRSLRVPISPKSPVPGSRSRSGARCEALVDVGRASARLRTDAFRLARDLARGAPSLAR